MKKGCAPRLFDVIRIRKWLSINITTEGRKRRASKWPPCVRQHRNEIDTKHGIVVASIFRCCSHSPAGPPPTCKTSPAAKPPGSPTPVPPMPLRQPGSSPGDCCCCCCCRCRFRCRDLDLSGHRNPTHRRIPPSGRRRRPARLSRPRTTSQD